MLTYRHEENAAKEKIIKIVYIHRLTIYISDAMLTATAFVNHRFFVKISFIHLFWTKFTTHITVRAIILFY